MQFPDAAACVAFWFRLMAFPSPSTGNPATSPMGRLASGPLAYDLGLTGTLGPAIAVAVGAAVAAAVDDGHGAALAVGAAAVDAAAAGAVVAAVAGAVATGAAAVPPGVGATVAAVLADGAAVAAAVPSSAGRRTGRRRRGARPRHVGGVARAEHVTDFRDQQGPADHGHHDDHPDDHKKPGA